MFYEDPLGLLLRWGSMCTATPVRSYKDCYSVKALHVAQLHVRSRLAETPFEPHMRGAQLVIHV